MTLRAGSIVGVVKSVRELAKMRRGLIWSMFMEPVLHRIGCETKSIQVASEILTVLLLVRIYLNKEMNWFKNAITNLYDVVSAPVAAKRFWNDWGIFTVELQTFIIR